MRHYHWYDHFIIAIQQCMHSGISHRPNPSKHLPHSSLSPKEIAQSSAMMRINHTGEVCAQALYIGQSITTKTITLRETFSLAAQEESDHLYWCQERLTELGSHKSYLNPLWFTGSLFIGMAAGWMGDRFSLGFLAQTEKQVFTHLAQHLENLPSADVKSRAIIMQMQEDEAKHATTAESMGGTELPYFIQYSMKITAKIMTSVAYYL